MSLIRRDNQNNDNPALLYVLSLKKSSRRVQVSALNAIAKIVNPDLDIYTMPWGELRYKQTAALAAKIKEDYAASTANRYISAIKGVLKEAWRLGLMTQEEMAKASDLKSTKDNSAPAGRALTREEIHRLLNACDTNLAYGLRDYTIMAMMWQCGFRRAEVVGLNIEDVDPNTGRIAVVKGKGNKDRVVFASGIVLEAVKAWAQMRGSSGDEPFFTSIDSRSSRLTPNAIYYMVKRYGEEVGIPDITPHWFRRTTATEMLESGADLLTVQKVGGWAKAETVMKYDRRGEDSLKKVSKFMDLED